MTSDLSKSLSQEARGKLINFIQACIESLRGQSFSESASNFAKEKGIELFRTDIDVMLVFISIKVMYSAEGVQLLRRTLSDKIGSRQAAEIIVRLVEEGRSMEMKVRNN